MEESKAKDKNLVGVGASVTNEWVTGLKQLVSTEENLTPEQRRLKYYFFCILKVLINIFIVCLMFITFYSWIWEKFNEVDKDKNKKLNKQVSKTLYYFISKFIVIVLFVERQIKALIMFGHKTWCTKRPFSYRVVHDGYLLTSCPGHMIKDIFSLFETKFLLVNKFKKYIFTLLSIVFYVRTFLFC